ncbi:MAG: DUF1704 domain-containing protein [Candidatus Woesebacteria bacterium]|jgi:hypothetical protein
MGFISDLTPVNIQEERKKFFSDFSYNPQFKYKKAIDRKILTYYGLPKKHIFLHSKKMLQQYPVPLKSKQVETSTEEVNKLIKTVFYQLGLKQIPIYYSPKYIGQAKLGSKGLYFQTPILLSKEKIIGKINHEIETHYLRRYNHDKQKLGKMAETPSFRKTEEGIATLHNYLFRKEKIMHKSYYHYYASYLARTQSFSRIFAALKKFNLNENFIWNIVVKKKRGLKDTSQAGGFTKDITYLEGAVLVWDWLINKANDPHLLYLGRLSLKQINQIKNEIQIKDKKIIYPTFFKDIKKYLQEIKQIGNLNQFNNLIN